MLAQARGADEVRVSSLDLRACAGALRATAAVISAPLQFVLLAGGSRSPCPCRCWPPSRGSLVFAVQAFWLRERGRCGGFVLSVAYTCVSVVRAQGERRFLALVLTSLPV